MGKPAEMPLRLWAMLPLTLIFGAVVFRMSWNVTTFFGASGETIWWLAIAGAATGYYCGIRLLSRPISMNSLNLIGIRLAVIIGVAISLIMGSIYLYHQMSATIAVISKVVLGTAIFTNVGGYLFLVLLIRPKLSSGVESRPLRIGMTSIMTIGLVSLTIHTIRFLPSPEAAYIQSKLMAVLLLAALIAVYPLVIKYIWCVWREKESSYPTWLPR